MSPGKWNAESERPSSAGELLQSPHGWMPPSTPQEFRVLHSFPFPFLPQGLSATEDGNRSWHNDHTARTVFEARGLLHCFCVKYLRLWITKGNLLKDQNRKQKEPVLELLTNPRTSYRLFDRKKKKKDIWVLKKGMNKFLWGRWLGWEWFG